jgi:dTMP kinase
MIAADRAQHMATVVLPALEAGRHVVSDRSVYSSLAYQGYGRSLDLADIQQFNSWAIHDRWPDLVILLEVPPEETERRLTSRDLDRFELENAAFHRRVSAGFREFAAQDPGRWVRIDATLPKVEVTSLVRAAVAERLGL